MKGRLEVFRAQVSVAKNAVAECAKSWSPAFVEVACPHGHIVSLLQGEHLNAASLIQSTDLLNFYVKLNVTSSGAYTSALE